MSEWYNAELFNITSYLFEPFKNIFIGAVSIIFLIILIELAIFLCLKIKKEWM